jgi:hypothetical protein
MATSPRAATASKIVFMETSMTEGRSIDVRCSCARRPPPSHADGTTQVTISRAIIGTLDGAAGGYELALQHSTEDISAVVNIGLHLTRRSAFLAVLEEKDR